MNSKKVAIYTSYDGFRIKSGKRRSEYTSNQALVFRKIKNQIGFSIVTALLISVMHIVMCEIGNCNQTSTVENLTEKQAETIKYINKILENHETYLIRQGSELGILRGKLNKLEASRKALPADKTGGAALDFNSELNGIIKERVNTLKETIKVRVEIVKEANTYKRVLKILSSLAERKNRLQDESARQPASQFESILKEVALAKTRLEVIRTAVKEMEISLAASETTLDSAKLKSEDEKKRLGKKLESLVAQTAQTEDEVKQIENNRQLLKNKIKLIDEKTEFLRNQNTLARLRLQTAQIQENNIQSEIDINTQIAAILSQRFKEEEATSKRAKEERARIAEEERNKRTEEEKVKIEREKELALKKADAALQKQIEEISPEKKRVLEVEADVHKQEGIIATIKDELINEDTERYKDRTELKMVSDAIEKMLGGENTSSEIDEELQIIETHLKRASGKVETIQGFLVAVEKQRAIINESLENVRATLSSTTPGQKSSIEKEAEGFSDKVQAEKLVKFADLRLKLIEEQAELIQTKIERLNERLEINKILYEKLMRSKKEFSQIRAANVWARRENTISRDTFQSVLSDIRSLKNKSVGFFNVSIQNVKKIRLFLSDTGNMREVVKKLSIITAVILLSYFMRSYLKRWAREKKEKFITITPQTFFTFKLVPGLLQIMLDTLTVSLLFVISLSISITVPSRAPLLLSAMYGFAIFSVYKLLKGFVEESFSPYGGKRWAKIPYFSAKLLFRDLNILLIFSAVSLTLLSVLSAHQYAKKDVMELIWFVYRIVSLFLIILIAAKQRSYLLRLLPYPGSALGKIINKIINLIYPLLIGFVISLFALRSLGFVLLTYALIWTLIKTISVVIIFYIAHVYLLKLLLHSQKNRLKECRLLEIKEMETEERGINVRFRVYQKILHYGTVTLSVVMVLGILNDTFKDVVSSPAAPVMFLEVYESVLYVLVSIKNSLTYKFGLAEGRYTTPFKMLFGILVLAFAFVLARYLKGVLQTRFYDKSTLELGVQQSISAGVKYSIIGIAAIIGLNVAGIPLQSLTIFAGAFGIGVGFGMQNIINNLVSGIIILFERPIKIGDVINIQGDIGGTVENISIRSTTIKTFDRTTAVVPNSKFLEGSVINWVHGGDMLLRAKIIVGVAYGSNTELVHECLLKVSHSHPDVEKDPEPVVRFAEFGDSSLNFQLYVWAHISKRWMVISDLHFAIDKIFRENGIEIAFPQRDLHIRSAIPMKTEFTR
ncbi:MAG: mechanosensitive ion channel [Candidatus Scalindua sp.]|nr:mechanosensitive ion channel [Candidatus Scalindua sp.]